MKKIIYIFLLLPTISGIIPLSLSRPAAAAVPLHEAVAMAGTAYAARDILARMDDVKEKVVLLKKITRRSGKVLDETFLSSEEAREIAKELEKTGLLKKIVESDETLEDLNKRLRFLQIIFVLDVALGLGILIKNVLPWGTSTPGPDNNQIIVEWENPDKKEEPAIEPKDPIQKNPNYQDPLTPPKPITSYDNIVMNDAAENQYIIKPGDIKSIYMDKPQFPE